MVFNVNKVHFMIDEQRARVLIQNLTGFVRKRRWNKSTGVFMHFGLHG